MSETNNVQEEFLRLMRALYESIERESELQRQLRRTKETLVSTALRLQVAIKTAQEDEITMMALLQQAETAKAKEIVATKKVEEATDTINSLSIEVNSLKRRLKTLESERNQANNQLSQSQHFDHINSLADAEVDELFDQQLKTEIPNYIDPVVANAATPFDRWKMNAFLYAPDTPAGSKAHDTHAVQMLLRASTAELSPEKITRPTQSSIVRAKRIMEAPRNTETRAFSPSNHNAKSPFFLGSDPEQSWSHKPAFDRENLGRVNIWTTNKYDQPSTASNEFSSSESKQRKNIMTPNPAMTTSGPVKLKSLRLERKDVNQAREMRSLSPPRERKATPPHTKKVLI